LPDQLWQRHRIDLSSLDFVRWQIQIDEKYRSFNHQNWRTKMPQYASILDHANDARTRILEVAYDTLDYPGESGTVYLDVREPSEFATGHIDGALNLSWTLIEANVGEIVPDKSTPIVAYCAIGHRSAIAADILQNLGYTQVVSIKGGLQGIGESSHFALVA